MARVTPIDQLLDGAVDTHMHTAPDVFDRQDTDFSAARKARDHGMAAILIKNHHFETGTRAQMASDETGFTVLGGVTLNKWIGGLNPDAVDAAAKLGVSVVWMPTITSANHIKNGSVPHLNNETDRGEAAGISVLDDSGELVQDALDVVDMIADHQVVLALGHLSPTEGLRLTEAAVDRGVDEILCIHPHAPFLDYSHDQLTELVDLGVTVELHYATTTPMLDEAATVEDLAAAAEVLGPENVIMATDAGSTLNEPAMEMFKRFIREMLDVGVSESDIKHMVSDTPKRVYGID